MMQNDWSPVSKDVNIEQVEGNRKWYNLSCVRIECYADLRQ